MTPESPADVLERLLQANNLGWVMEMHASKDRVISVLLEQLDGVMAEYRRRLRVEVALTPEALTAESEKNPHKVRAFLQALAATGSREMLVMVWRILQGLSIRQVDMHYREQQAFRLEIALARPGAEQDEFERYGSDEISDAALVRHFGITTLDGRPLFDGFFPLRKK